MNSYDLLAKITVSARAGEFYYYVNAQDKDPEIAKKIATTLSNEFVDDRVAYYNTQDKANRIEVKLVDSVIDAPLFKPKPVTNALAGFVFV